MKPEKEDQSSYIPLNLDTRSSAREPAKWHRICILIISFMLVMLGAGLSHSYGVFLVYFVNEKVVTPTEGAWAIGLEQFFFYGTGKKYLINAYLFIFSIDIFILVSKIDIHVYRCVLLYKHEQAKIKYILLLLSLVPY